MLEYLLFLIKKSAIKLLCNLIPNKTYRKKARSFLNNTFSSGRIISINDIDSHIPLDILKQINAVDNEFFITQNAQSVNGGGGLAF